MKMIDDDIANKFVILKKKALKAEYHDIKQRVFLARGGFGCHVKSIGSAVFGAFVCDGELVRQERYSVERMATKEEALEAIKLNPEGKTSRAMIGETDEHLKWDEMDLDAMTRVYEPFIMSICFKMGKQGSRSWEDGLKTVVIKIDPRLEEEMWDTIQKIDENYNPDTVLKGEYSRSKCVDKFIEYFKEAGYLLESDDRTWDFDTEY